MLSGVTQERNLRSKIRWFTELCNSHYVSHFAAFFIVARTETSIAKSCEKLDCVFVYSGDWGVPLLVVWSIKVSTQQQTKNTEDRIKQFETLVLHLIGFKRAEKGPPLEKPVRPRKSFQKVWASFLRGEVCKVAPLAVTLLNSAAQSLSETSPKREKLPSASGRRIILWSSK